MKRPSELELYLRSQSGLGMTVETDQAFSISKERALKKLAAYQLPFDGPWALKIVQFAVANGKIRSLKIDLTSQDVSFGFTGKVDFGLTDFEEAFYDPNYADRADLKHLIIGLHKIGFNKRHPFWLSFSNELEALCWDGETLHRVSCREELSPGSDYDVSLTISSFPKGAGPWVRGLGAKVTSSKFKAELTQVLSQRAFVCPIPLTLDGRRIDALQNDPHHGWSPDSQTLVMGFSESSLPYLPIPPHTFEHVSGHSREASFQAATSAIAKYPETLTEFSFAYLLSVHLSQDQEHGHWSDGKGLCHLYWILDGVILDQEALTREPRFFSGGCFASASDLKTDITGFQLQDNEQKNARYQECKQLFYQALDHTRQLDFEKMRGSILLERRYGGKALLGVAALFSLMADPTGIFAGVLLGGVGAFVSVSGTGQPEKRQAQIADCVEHIRQELFPGGLAG